MCVKLSNSQIFPSEKLIMFYLFLICCNELPRYVEYSKLFKARL